MVLSHQSGSYVTPIYIYIYIHIWAYFIPCIESWYLSQEKNAEQVDTEKNDAERVTRKSTADELLVVT